MKSEQERPIGKVRYEKPTAVDLGPAAPVIGASCAPGDQFDANGVCGGVGNHASVDCSPGNKATFACLFGKDESVNCGDGGGLL